MPTVVRAVVLFVVVVGLVACGKKSPTGKPGPLGKAWDAAAAFKHFRPKGVVPPDGWAADLAAIKAALPFAADKRKVNTRTINLDDDGKLAAQIVLKWQTFPIGARHLVVAAQARTVKLGDTYSCTSKGAEVTGPGIGVDLFPRVQISVTCSAGTSNSSTTRSATAYFGDTRGGDVVLLQGWNDKDDSPRDKLFPKRPERCKPGAKGAFRVVDAQFRKADPKDEGDCSQAHFRLHVELIENGAATCKVEGVGKPVDGPVGATETMVGNSRKLVGTTIKGSFGVGQCWDELSPQ